MQRTERGAMLLEVLVALSILSTAGIALLALVTGTLGAEREARARERGLANAERVLTAMTLLRREDLDRRLGRRHLGEFVVDVQRPEQTLYRIAIAERDAAEMEHVVTVVYRPAP